MNERFGLIAFTDEQLIDELLWRGYRLDGLVGPSGGSLPRGVSAFRQHVFRTWGVRLPEGKIPERMIEYMLLRYPDTAHWEGMARHVWYDDPQGGPLEAIKSLHVTLVRIRRALEPTALRINTIWGVGVEIEFNVRSET